MKKNYETPKVLVQEFEVDEYIAACLYIGCDWNEANAWEAAHKSPSDITHSGTECGTPSHQVLIDSNNDGYIDAMYENSTQQGRLDCTLFKTDDYDEVADFNSIKVGATVYWRTYAADGRYWSHQGTADAQDPAHPNRS